MKKLFELFYSCSEVNTDSRAISPNSFYIALKGERFNGNKFAKDAIEKGAKYAIVDEKDYADNTTIFYVEDGLVFLQQLANYHRSKFSIPIIGITGSNGKTTTKELIANVLYQKYNILFTKGNLNNHIGVPLTLLNLKNTHDIAIIEMGASKPGDIKELTDIAEPTHGIITNIGKAHIEGFGSPEGVLKTKKELYDAIKQIGGTLFMNEDDSLLMDHVPTEIEYFSYGKSEKAYVVGELVKLAPNVHFIYKSKDYQSPILKTSIIGTYNFYNILSAICIGTYFEVPFEMINKGITSYAPKNNRSQVEKTKSNTLILDAYNANPTSVASALESFALMEHDEKLFILGDMLELGEISEEEHQLIIELTHKLKLNGVFVGPLFKKHEKEYENTMFFENKEAAASFLSVAQPKSNLILLKGSRGIGLEALVEVL